MYLENYKNVCCMIMLNLADQSRYLAVLHFILSLICCGWDDRNLSDASESVANLTIITIPDKYSKLSSYADERHPCRPT